MMDLRKPNIEQECDGDMTNEILVIIQDVSNKAIKYSQFALVPAQTAKTVRSLSQKTLTFDHNLTN